VSESNPGARKKRRRIAPRLWTSGAVAAGILVLGVNGTLASWTQAVITNDKNNVASAEAVSLIETGGAGTGADGTICDTQDTTTNTATCTTVNKYGGTSGGGQDSVPLSPGESRTATVALANNGTGTGNLVLGAAACQHVVNDATGGDTTALHDVCTQITVSVACTGDVTVAPTTPVALSAFTGLTIGNLAATQSTACTFTVSLPSNTPAEYSNQLASQVLTWTLTAV